jgi:hypothetical protein
MGVRRDSTSVIHSFKEAYIPVRREVLYNILFEFGVPMKIVRLITMCLNETCSEVCIGDLIFPIRNCKKMLYRHYFSTLLQNIA